MIPFLAGVELAEGIPGAAFVPIDSANHILLAGERGWTQFIEAMRDFLRG